MAFEASADKTEEAHHFLLLMRVAELPPDDGGVPVRLQGEAAFRFVFSAFLGATRALLYLLQEEGTRLPGFTRWYVTARERFMRGEFATFFGDRREFRLIFPNYMLDVRMAPPELPPPRIGPASPVQLPVVDVMDHLGQVRFEDRPDRAATELCARYLQQMVQLVDQARQLAS